MKYSSISRLGSREINEDSFLCTEQGSRVLCVVADGLGGHGHGEVASAIAAETLNKVFKESADLPLNELLDSAIIQAQNAIMAEQTKTGAYTEMKTTVVAVCTDGTDVCWGHVGDTRLYAFQNHSVKFRTLDHSIPQMLVLSGDIPERKIRNHPQRNLLLRVLGVEWDGPKHVISDLNKVSEYQAFLLCSDGFWELIDERHMCKLLKKSASPEEWLQSMTAVVEKNGKKKDMDNYTAVALWI